MINRLSSILLIAVGSVLIVYGTDKDKEYTGPKSPPITFYKYNSYLLPMNFKPSHYNITLKPDFQTLKTNGYVEIDLEVKLDETRVILLHTYKLTYDKIEMIDNSGTIIPYEHFGFNRERQFISIVFAKPFKLQPYKLKLTYTGILNRTAAGFFRGKYVNKEEEIRWFAATKFEPTYARRAFPCFDEPALKATFDINLVRLDGFTSISNMHLSHTWKKGEDFVDVFEQTPVMSTYLLSFVVCDFEYITFNDHFRIFATSPKIASGETDFALEMTPKILDVIETYTETKFPLKKLDQIAIPGFTFDPSENWGFITYSEDTFLLNKQTSTIREKQNTLMTIARELTNQWFGNLVTPIWWRYLWLKEGFATFMALQVVDTIKPQWRIKEQFMENTHICFRRDSVLSKSLSFDVDTPSQIEDKFNSLFTDKGAAVLRMLENVITPDAFREGIVKYLTYKQSGVTNPEDIWNVMHQAVANVDKYWYFSRQYDFSKVMQNWGRKSGYPVVTVIRNYRTGRVNFSQNMFYTDGIVPEKKDDDPKRWWYIPITWSIQYYEDFNNTRGKKWLINQNLSFLMEQMLEYRWLIVNNRATGYYRVNYDKQNWKILTMFLNSTDFETIHPLNRAQLINDAFNLARAGLLEYKLALNLTGYLHRETNYIVLSSFMHVMKYLDKMITESPLYHKFQRRIEIILDKALDKLGYKEVSLDDKEHINNMHRQDLIYWSCRMLGTRCTKNTTLKMYHLSDISTDLQLPIICGGLRHATRETWNMVDEYIKAADSTVKNRLKHILGCVENNDILRTYLDREMDKKDYRVFDYIYEKGNFGKRFIKNYMYAYFDKIYQVFRGNTSKIIIGLSSLLTTEEDLAKFKSFQSSAFPDVKESFVTAIENINANLKWAKQYLPEVTNWLNTLP